VSATGSRTSTGAVGRRAWRGVVVLVTALAALGSVAGAAGAVPAAEADKPPAKILADAKKATNNAKAVRIKGTVHSDGRDVHLDVISGHGRGGGTIGVDGATFHVVVDPPAIYLKAGASTWKQLTGSDAAVQLLANRWLKTTTSNADYSSFAKLVDVKQLTDSIGTTATITKRRTTRYHDTSAIPLVNTSSHGVLYVAAKGTPYILGIRDEQGNSELRFVDYGSATAPKVPKHPVDLSELEPTSTTQGPQSS
jgi:hypothetical protein